MNTEKEESEIIFLKKKIWRLEVILFQLIY